MIFVDILQDVFLDHSSPYALTPHRRSLASEDTPGSIAARPAESSGELRLVLFDASLEEWLRPEAAWGMETYTAPWTREKKQRRMEYMN